MNKVIISYVLISFFFFNCSDKKVYGEDIPVKVNRFDKALYEYLKGEKNEDIFLNEYRDFLDVYGESVIGIGKTDSIGYFDRLKQLFSHPSLMEIYETELKTFEDVSELEAGLSSGFGFLQSVFDSIQVPDIYMHVSGLNQNVVVTDRFLSISGDKYLGSEYKWYVPYFYDYLRQNMTPERVLPDYFLGFLMANFPFQGNDEVLLDQMIYEGKLRYILSLTLPTLSNAEIMGYTEEQNEWCKANESRMWKNIVQDKHLFNPNRFITEKYIHEAPYTSFLSNESPGKAGIWIGFQIVVAYVKQHPEVSLQELMYQTNYKKILQDSKYKP